MWPWLAVGYLAGALSAVLLIALCLAAGRDDDGMWGDR